jgi:hypothetical protein
LTSTWYDYVIAEEIGRGSFGAVYKAWHPTLRQHVALKLIPVTPGNEREIERALDEPRRLASVHHHNVVTVHDARYADGHVGICMELISGESFAQMIERRGPLGPDEVTSSAVTLCKALSAIHRVQVIHNDVKAQNVMRQDGGRIVLMDFGAGKHLIEADKSTGLYLVGTPVYMAPELFEFRDATFASDIYSLGVLMFYLLTGQYPVDGGTVQEIARAHAAGNARRYLGDLRDDVPERLLAIVERALAPSPGDRYHTCGELLHTLTSSADVLPEPRKRQRSGEDDPSGDRDRRKRAAPDPVARLRRFVWADVAMIAAAFPAIWLIGFLSSRAHAVMFGLRGDFDTPAPFDWLVVGFRTLPLPIVSVMVAAAVYVFATYAWRMTTRVSTRVRTWSSGLSGTLSSGGAVDLTDASVLAPLVLTAQALGLALLYWAFHDVIAAITTPLDEALIPAHASLAQNGWQDVLFCMFSSALAFGSAVGWLAVLRHRRPRDGWAAIMAGGALTILFVAMATVPWKTIYESEFPVAVYEDQHCYLVASTTADALLMCPWRAAGRRVVAAQGEFEFPAGKETEGIFSAVAARLRAEGGE